jgi:hypothetical protein
MASQTPDTASQTPAPPPKKPPPPDSWPRRVKRFVVSRQKGVWGVFLAIWRVLLALLPLIGVLVGGWITWHTGTEQAQKNFTQSQRKEAYAAFDGAIDGFREAVWAEQRLYRPPGIPDNPLAPPVKENLGEGVNNLLFAESKITFYGSDEVHKMADEVVKQMWVIRDSLAGFIYNHPNYPHLNETESCDFFVNVDETHDLIYKNLRDAQANFRNAARKDLGLQPLPRDSYDPLYPPPPHAVAAPAPPPSAVPAPGGPPRCVRAAPGTVVLPGH